ncbi:unannotated protein [freshwater metagenome]|uniref:Unannotated protein n=1 Tax=freshwater metagenome TaxID=449393 RepID=A0A6J6PHS1_9ZZZZ
MTPMLGWVHLNDRATDHLSEAGFVPTRRKVLLVFEPGLDTVEGQHRDLLGIGEEDVLGTDHVEEG